MVRENVKVLLTEDSLFATRRTQQMLSETNGFQINVKLECVDKLSLCLKRLAERDIDIVLLDLTLPDSYGLDTFTKVHTQAPEIPVVVLTGLEDETLAIEAVRCGAQDYLVKGQLDGNVLKRSILYALERKKTEEELRGHREHLEELVDERTQEIKKTNKSLKAEIIQRQAVERALRTAYKDLEKAHKQLSESQSQLIQTEKMSALGVLVAGTAHELNNPMMGILNFASHCIEHSSDDDRLLPVLQDIRHETKRCIEIVQNLLTFSHASKDDGQAYREGSLPEIFDRVFRLLSYRIEKQGISITQHFADGTPPIWMDANGIQQLVLNLTMNALDALIDSEKRELNVDMRGEGEFVRIEIADTGCGIAPESLGAIFDPFFTTKTAEQGTGLGLSVSQGIVTAHGGEITCESKPGAGTKFVIQLPINGKMTHAQ